MLSYPEEVEYFAVAEIDAERIFFPPALQELCEKETIIGANIHDIDKGRAFLKVIARMHGLALAEIESAEDRRRKKKRIVIILSSTAGALFILFIGLGLYSFLIPHTKYYVDFTEVYGVPVGIREVTKEETKSMDDHYAIISSEYLVRELRHEDSAFHLIPQEGTENGNKPIDVVYSYDEDETLEKTTYRDKDENAKLTCKYSNNLKVIDFILEGEYTHSSFLSSGTVDETPFVWRSDGENGSVFPTSKSSIVRLLVGYDAHGYLSNIRYVSDLSTNEPAAESNGTWGIRYERDARGRITGISYLTYQGEAASHGAEKLSNYMQGSLGNGIYEKTFQYDEKGDLVVFQYKGKDGEPVENAQGWAIKEISYDAKHNVVKEAYFDHASQPTLDDGGIAVKQYAYDKKAISSVPRSLTLLANPSCMLKDMPGCPRRMTTKATWRPRPFST